MLVRPKRWLVALPLLATACSPPDLQVIDETAISAVQNEIDRQIGVYIAASRQVKTIKVAELVDSKAVLVSTPVSALTVPAADPNKELFSCGNGDIAFDVSSIKAELMTSFDQSFGVSGSATIPAQVVTVGPSAGLKDTASNTQTLAYEAWPLIPGEQTNLDDYTATQKEIDAAPIAKVLIGLRSALLASSTRYDYSKLPVVLKPDPRPCFTDYNPKKILDAPADTYKLGLSFVSGKNVGLTIAITVLKLGATGEWKSTTGNTLTVSFAQPGLESLATAEDKKTKDCTNSPASAACKAATEAAAKKRKELRDKGKFGEQ